MSEEASQPDHAPTKPPLVDTAFPEERAAAGKAAREKVPRSSHGEWEPPALRLDPVKVLEDQAMSRVQELVPIDAAGAARTGAGRPPGRRRGGTRYGRATK